MTPVPRSASAPTATSVWDTVTYEMTSGTTSVSNLDIGTLTQDMVSRGYTKSSWYLIDVEAGFELWQGGAGPSVTFPGSQQISNLWNGSYTQTGAAVTVTSASHDSSLPAGGTATVGFTASYTGSNSAPATVTCS